MNYRNLQDGFETRHTGYPDGIGAAAAMLPSARYILPTFEERTAYGYKRQDLYAKLSEDRIAFLGEQIDDNSADGVMAQPLILEGQNSDSLITMYINSPGGSFTATAAIYDTTQYIKSEIQTVCLGQAASAAAVLLAGGPPGKRLTLPNARVLIHQPAIQGVQGQATNPAIVVEEIDRMQAWLEETLSKHSGHTLEQMHGDIGYDRILIAVQTEEHGLIDQVLSPQKGSNNQGLNGLLAFFSRGESLGCGYFAWATGWHLMKRENT